MQVLRRLLKKKNPSGEDLGRINAADNAIALEARRNGKVSEPIMDLEKFDNDLNALSDSEWAIFNRYKYISEFLNLYYNIAESMEQQAERADAVIYSFLSESALTEDTFAYISKLPAIMTQEQYEAESEKGIFNWTHHKDGSQRMWSTVDIFCHALSHYLGKIEEAPRKKNPLQPVKRKYRFEPVGSDIVRGRYNEAAKYGYYETPDGKRSDAMTPSKWKRATTTAKMRKLESASIADNAKEWKSLSDLIKALDEKRIRYIWEGKERLSSDSEREALIEAGFMVRQTFKLYDEPPARLTKWEIAKDPLLMADIYPAIFCGLSDPDAFKKEIIDFTHEFSDLTAAILEAVDADKWFDFKIAGTPAEEWSKPLISLQAIYDMDFYGIAEAVRKSTETLFPDNERAKQNGVAIVQPGTGWNFLTTDERGYYRQPSISHSVGTPHRLEDIIEGAPQYQFTAKTIYDCRESLLDSHYFLTNWNIFLDMVDLIYKIPHLDVYRISPVGIEKKIRFLNKLTMDLYSQVFHTDYGEAGDSLKADKLEAIKKHLPEIDYSNSEAPNENINKIYSLLTDTRLFAAPEIIEGLMLRRIKPTEGE